MLKNIESFDSNEAEKYFKIKVTSYWLILYYVWTIYVKPLSTKLTDCPYIFSYCIVVGVNKPYHSEVRMTANINLSCLSM